MEVDDVRRAVAVRMIREGATFAAAAKAAGVSDFAVRQWCKAAGIRSRGSMAQEAARKGGVTGAVGPKPGARWEARVAKAMALVRKGATFVAAGKAVGASASAVRQWCGAAGVRSRAAVEQEERRCGARGASSAGDAEGTDSEHKETQPDAIPTGEPAVDAPAEATAVAAVDPVPGAEREAGSPTSGSDGPTGALNPASVEDVGPGTEGDARLREILCSLAALSEEALLQAATRAGADAGRLRALTAEVAALKEERHRLTDTIAALTRRVEAAEAWARVSAGRTGDAKTKAGRAVVAEEQVCALAGDAAALNAERQRLAVENAALTSRAEAAEERARAAEGRAEAAEEKAGAAEAWTWALRKTLPGVGASETATLPPDSMDAEGEGLADLEGGIAEPSSAGIGEAPGVSAAASVPAEAPAAPPHRIQANTRPYLPPRRRKSAARPLAAPIDGEE